MSCRRGCPGPGSSTDDGRCIFSALLPRCSRVFEARLNAPSDHCPDCQKALREEFQKIYNVRRRVPVRERRTSWEIVEDALDTESGGFPPGASFDFLELHLMLEGGDLQDGTRLRYQETVYCVQGKLLVDEQGHTHTIDPTGRFLCKSKSPKTNCKKR